MLFFNKKGCLGEIQVGVIGRFCAEKLRFLHKRLVVKDFAEIGENVPFRCEVHSDFIHAILEVENWQFCYEYFLLLFTTTRFFTKDLTDKTEYSDCVRCKRVMVFGR